MKKTLMCWSSGKDSAWALHTLRKSGEYDVVALLTTITSDYNRVSMHAVRRELVEMQAAAAGLPLWTAEIPAACTNPIYEEAMRRAVRRALDEGIRHIAFGDLYLEDVRAYRESKLAGSGVQPLFPLWKRDTSQLAAEMIAGGLRARVTCVDPRVLPASFAGRRFDADFVRDLPPDVDPCGERGEFHTFAYEGPMFARPIPIETGETIQRDGFVFTDLVCAGVDRERTYRGAGNSARAW